MGRNAQSGKLEHPEETDRQGPAARTPAADQRISAIVPAGQGVPSAADRDDVLRRMRAAYTSSQAPLDLAKEDLINRGSAYLICAAALEEDSRVRSILLECDYDGGDGLTFHSMRDGAGKSLGSESSDLDDGDVDELAGNLVERRHRSFPDSITPVPGNDGMYRLNVAAALADRP